MGMSPRAPAEALAPGVARQLTRAGGHLDQAVALCVQGALQLQHVAVLLRVDVGVGEKNLQFFYAEPHAAEHWVTAKRRSYADTAEVTRLATKQER